MRKSLAIAAAALVVCSAAATAQAGFIGSTVYAGWRGEVDGFDPFGQTDSVLADSSPVPEFTNYSAGGWLLDPISVDFNDNSITVDHFAAPGLFTGGGYAFNGLVFGLALDATAAVKSVLLHSDSGFLDASGVGLDAARATVDPLTHEIRLNLAGYAYLTTSTVTLDVTFADATPPQPVPEPGAAVAVVAVVTLRRRRRAARQTRRCR